MPRISPSPISVPVRRHEAAWRELSSIIFLLRGFKTELNKVVTEHEESPLRRVETYQWLIDVVEPISTRGLDDIIDVFASVPSPETTAVHALLLSLDDHVKRVPMEFADSLEHHAEQMLRLTENLLHAAEGSEFDPLFPAA